MGGCPKEDYSQKMKYELLIRPEAEKDLKESFVWYEDKRIGLGFNFLLQFEAGLHFITRNPTVSSKKYKDVRMYLLKRFPFKLFYLVNKNQIIVLAVLHSKRRPSLLKKRARGK